MKNIITAAILITFSLLSTQTFGQQQPHNTQFMYYKLGYNPGYAGSRESACVTCIVRQQWVGLDGAPAMQAVTFNMPLMNQRVGLGANLSRQTIGISQVINMDAVYSYRVRLGQGMLGVGVQTSLRNIENDFQQTTATQSKADDPSIPATTQNKMLFNFGAGLYYSTERFYFGLSVPRLLENNIDFSNEDVFVSREVQHVYLMAGVTIPLNEQLKLQPQTLLKYVGNAPVGADANLNLIISERYIAGLTYRLGGDKTDGTGESLDILIAAQLTNHLMFGLSYDFTLSDIKDYGPGSIEASVHYCFGKASGDKEYVNPRFF